MRRKAGDPGRDKALLLDMLTAAQATAAFVKSQTFEDYEKSLFLRSAVERQIEIIGEDARGISEELRSAHPRLAHEYGEIDDALIWRVATVHVSVLVTQLESLLSMKS